MPVATPSSTIDRLNSGQGRGGLHPPGYGGGGDRGNGGEGPPEYERRLYRARLALVLAMGSICVLFVTVTVALLWWQSNVAANSDTYVHVRAWAPVSLPIRLLLWNTFVLLLASGTIEMAGDDCRPRSRIPRRPVAGLGSTPPTWVSRIHGRHELFFLLAHWRACPPCFGGYYRAAVRMCNRASAPLNRTQANHSRNSSMVLAFYGSFVAGYFRALAIRTLKDG